MHPSDALEELLLIEKSLRSHMAIKPRQAGVDAAEFEKWLTIARDAYDILKVASPYYVARPICEFVRAAADTIPADWVLTGDCLPTSKGFIWLAEGIALPEGWDADHPLRAIAFSTGSVGVYFFTFADTINASLGAHAMPFSRIEWTWGMSIQDVIDYHEKKYSGDWDETEGLGILKVRFIGALLAFVRQNILISASQQALRATRKRVATEKKIDPEQVPLVNVIELRRREYTGYSIPSSEGEAHREYSCQWLVRGHWRQQWYARLGKHQPKWIAGYAKGPEDKPLKAPRATVFAVVR